MVLGSGCVDVFVLVVLYEHVLFSKKKKHSKCQTTEIMWMIYSSHPVDAVLAATGMGCAL